MSIDWTSLLLVAVVTIAATALVAIIMASGARLLDRSQIITTHPHDKRGETRATVDRVAGTVLIGVVGLMALFGLWLVVPYFH